jgi:glycosyltransferase involved in cell wall biosynthesis
MRIGIHRSTSWHVGGGYVYELSMLDALAEVARSSRHELVSLVDPGQGLHDIAATGELAYRGMPMLALGEADTRQAPPETYAAQPARVLKDPPSADALYVDNDRAAALRALGIDLLFQLHPGWLGFSTLTPFVMPVHDLNHRLLPEFEEVTAGGEFELREYLYNNACRFGTLIVAESPQGRDDILRFYGHLIAEDRIAVLPLQPPFHGAHSPAAQRAGDEWIAQRRLPADFLFYPAQFWRHKNHVLIVEALAILAERHKLRLPLLLCGSYRDRLRAQNFLALMARARELGVADLVTYLGFVPDHALPALYRHALALTMPTFFGPTNYPPLEAWTYGCPVIGADIHGAREFLGEDALLADPRSAESLAEAVRRLAADRSLRESLAARGRARAAAYDRVRFVGQVGEIVERAANAVATGRSPAYPRQLAGDRVSPP